MKTTLLLFALLFSATLSAQRHIPDSLILSEMSKLHFIAGNWAGEGWILQRDGTKHTFTQTEQIEFKLDSTLLLIEGKGMAQGEVIHHAVAIISYDKQSGKYRFNSHLPDGTNGNYDAELIGDQFYWYPFPEMRYIIYLNENGQWYEKGEMLREGNWFQFFEMTLDRI